MWYVYDKLCILAEVALSKHCPQRGHILYCARGRLGAKKQQSEGEADDEDDDDDRVGFFFNPSSCSFPK